MVGSQRVNLEPAAHSPVRRSLIGLGGLLLFPTALFAGYELLSLTSLGGLLGLRPPLEWKRPGYTRVLVFVDRLAPAASPRRVVLPPTLSGTVAGGAIWVEDRPLPSGGTARLVLFPTWLGRGDDLQGYLHAGAPLDLSSGAGTVCGSDQAEVEQIHGPWYWVYRRVD